MLFGLERVLVMVTYFYRRKSCTDGGLRHMRAEYR